MPASKKNSFKVTALNTQLVKNNFLPENQISSTSPKWEIKISQNLTECHNLWNKFSPNESVFDLWEIRDAFYQGYKFSPHFLSIYQKSEIVGVLPLWFNATPTFGKTASDFEKYTWFGSNWPEDNTFFVQDPQIIPFLLLSCPKPVELACIKPLPSYDFLKEYPGYALEEDKKYFLDLSQVNTLDDFLSQLKKKKRYNLRRDRKRIMHYDPIINIEDHENIEEMFRLSIERFRKKYPDEPSEQSAFEDERRKEVFRSLINNAKDYKVRLITTTINGKIEAVEFGLVYKKTYYALNAGVDVSHFSGLGVFSNLLVIEDALNLGCTKIDFLESDNNWKASWHLSTYYQYQFTK
ncbi:GNAT family N-acetyltransferase [Candidatus Gottesmanbacteria bacterium]|nr:GNAT family N-acetyltransferase [Candidatus Gottesmanbacteria bacterium]